MTYDEYWNKDCTMVIYYRKAWKEKQKIKKWDFWNEGMYFYDVLLRVAPVLHAFAKNGTKPLPYLEKPYGIEEYENNEIDKQKEIENERIKARIHFENVFRQLTVRFNKKGR